MSFLQPLILFALPLAALPVIIHLLNRMRFRTVEWAATRFLARADRESTRWERIKRWLVLAMRVLALLCLILAVARPLVGGWMGWAMGGAPDTVVVVIDRSASMAAASAVEGKDLRTTAIASVQEALASLRGGSRVVVFDPVLAEFHELSDATLLGQMRATAPSDAAVDFREVVRSISEWCRNQKSGRTEVWIASDLQRGNWGEAASWPDTTAGLAALEPPVRVRLLAMSNGTPANEGLSIEDAHAMGKGSEISLTVERWGGASDGALLLDGTRGAWKGAEGRTTSSYKVRQDAGWGRIELPPDSQPADNAAQFLYRPAPARRVAIKSDDSQIGDLLALAASGGVSADAIGIGSGPLNDALQPAWLLVWQGAAPAGEQASAIEKWLREGGVAVFLPSMTGPSGTFSGVAMGEAADNTSAVSRWDHREGALADTLEGHALPLDRLEVSRRVPISGARTQFAGFSDDHPFVAAKRIGSGTALWLATLPSPEWSTLGDGRVLVPFLLRLGEQGRRRLEAPFALPVGLAPQAPAGQPWTRIDREQPDADPRETAGVYASGSRLLAVNVPSMELDASAHNSDAVAKFLSPVKVDAFETGGRTSGDLQSEAWRGLLFLVMLGLVAEAWLSLPGRGRRITTPNRPRATHPPLGPAVRP